MRPDELILRFRATSYKDHIYSMIREMTSGVGANRQIRIADVMEKCSAKGYKPDQVNEVLDDYEDLNVWQLNAARTRLTVVQ